MSQSVMATSMHLLYTGHCVLKFNTFHENPCTPLGSKVMFIQPFIIHVSM